MALKIVIFLNIYMLNWVLWYNKFHEAITSYFLQLWCTKTHKFIRTINIYLPSQLWPLHVTVTQHLSFKKLYISKCHLWKTGCKTPNTASHFLIMGFSEGFVIKCSWQLYITAASPHGSWSNFSVTGNCCIAMGLISIFMNTINGSS